MMMTHFERIALAALFIIPCGKLKAQTMEPIVAAPLSRMNEIKRSPDYIYADFKSIDRTLAYNKALEYLRGKIAIWLMDQKMPAVSDCLVKSEEHFCEISREQKMTKEYQSFVYVKKSDIVMPEDIPQVIVAPKNVEESEEKVSVSNLTISIKAEEEPIVVVAEQTSLPVDTVTLLPNEVKEKNVVNDRVNESLSSDSEESVQQNEATTIVEPVATHMQVTPSTSQETSIASQEPTIKTQIVKEKTEESISDNAVQTPTSRFSNSLTRAMVKVSQFSEIFSFIMNQKADSKIVKYGREETRPTSGHYYMFLFDKEGKIHAYLIFDKGKVINIVSGKTDSLDNYKEYCTTFWFN